MDSSTSTGSPARRLDQPCTEHGSAGRLRRECPTCHDEMLARHAAAAQAETAARNAAARAERTARRLDLCGVEGRYRNATFDGYRTTIEGQRRALKTCTTFCETFSRDAGGTLFLIGPPGTGKTHLLSAMVTSVIKGHDCAAELLTGPGLIRRVRASWSKAADQSEEQVLDELGRVSLLAIDEIGLAVPTESELRILFEVIDRRYSHGRPTLIASNLTLPMLAELLGERIFDRLAENHTAVVMSWPSFRQAARKP